MREGRHKSKVHVRNKTYKPRSLPFRTLTATLAETMDDARRKRLNSSGMIEALCTICEEEGMPYVPATHAYVIISTMSGHERMVTACSDHADRLEKGKMSYQVVRKMRGFEWDETP